MVAIDKRLWLDKNGKVVEDGDPAAATLFATPGDEVTEERAIEVGLFDEPAPAKGWELFVPEVGGRVLSHKVSPKRAGKKQIESVEEA